MAPMQTAHLMNACESLVRLLPGMASLYAFHKAKYTNPSRKTINLADRALTS